MSRKMCNILKKVIECASVNSDIPGAVGINKYDLSTGVTQQMSLLSAKNLYNVASCEVVEYSVKYNVTMHSVVNALLHHFSI